MDNAYSFESHGDGDGDGDGDWWCLAWPGSAIVCIWESQYKKSGVLILSAKIKLCGAISGTLGFHIIGAARPLVFVLEAMGLVC